MSKQPTKDDAEQKLKKFHLFGYEIGGWGAALAFILAVIGLIWQAWGYFIGPDARVLPIRSIEFACSVQDGERCEPDANLIVVVDRLAVANFGAEGYDTSVDPGIAQLVFLDAQRQPIRSITLTAQFFTERTQIEFGQKPASKIYLKAGSGLDYEVAYYPRMKVSPNGHVSRDNFVPWSVFKGFLASGVDGKQIERFLITLHPSALGRNSSKMEQSCEVIADERMRLSSADPEIGTIPRDCIQSS